MSMVLVLRGDDEAIEAQAKRYKLSVSHDAPASVKFGRALVVKAGTSVPWALAPNGLHFVKLWDAACPIWRYNATAEEMGTADERKITKALTLDLRIPVYACEMLFVGTTAPKGGEALGRPLLEAWYEEMERGPDERLAFLRAVARVKPRLCTLPAEWVGGERKTRQPYSRGAPVVSPVRGGKRKGPVGLVRVEVGPGRYVQCRPENVERVKADFEKRNRRGG